MTAHAFAFAFAGIDCLDIDVQVQIAAGFVGFTIVGLPDKAVGESRARVRAAFNSLGLALPPKRITVNLGLDGSIAAVAGVLPAAIAANAAGRGLIGRGAKARKPPGRPVEVLSRPIPMMSEDDVRTLDLRDIKGQESAKRAQEVTAADGHNLLMLWPITPDRNLGTET